MRPSPAILVTLATSLSLAALAPRAQTLGPADHAAVDHLALTPPMGWYPWNEFGQEPQNETLIREIADALVKSGMKDAGYAYVGPDEGICFSRGADGRLTPNLARYPSGLRGLGDYIHGLGLKYALYTDAGTRTCSKAMPGTKGHETEDMASFAAWRADYVKIDWCNTEGQDIVKTYTALSRAQRAAGRPIIHSLCSWGDGEPWKWAASIGHMWRTTGDICGPGHADWSEAIKIAGLNEKLYGAAGPGHWNDPDMMIAGMDGLSDTQNRSFFSLWCMMAAPLMAGNDLRRMTDATARVLTNQEAIAINQDPLGVQGRIVRMDGAVEIWAAKPLFDGSRAVLVFNKGKAPATIKVTWEDAGFPDAAALFVRDLWDHKTTGPHGGGIPVTVAPDGASFLRVSKSERFAIPPIIVADTYRIVLHTEGESGKTLSGAITVRNAGSDELPTWKVASGLPAWLTVTVARNGKTQTLTNTVSTAGLPKGSYHAVVRADTIEPVSGKPLSALYYDVDVEVTSAGHRDTNGGK
ncbi:MAG: glycoside hydrolase family 27 protein [Bacteroidales bacterium]